MTFVHWFAKLYMHVVSCSIGKILFMNLNVRTFVENETTEFEYISLLVRNIKKSKCKSIFHTDFRVCWDLLEFFRSFFILLEFTWYMSTFSISGSILIFLIGMKYSSSLNSFRSLDLDSSLHHPWNQVFDQLALPLLDCLGQNRLDYLC